MSGLKRRFRNTKIIATLGPTSSSAARVLSLARAGVNVFRLNFSHGTHAEHQLRHGLVREAEQKLGQPLGVLADLQGPKLRVGEFEGGRVTLQSGDLFRLDGDAKIGDATRVELPHPEIIAALKVGHQLLLDDGKLRLQVETAAADHAITRVLVGGALSSRKGVSTPDSPLELSALTEKDRRDLGFALGLQVDWVALSFVQRARDVMELRQLVSDRAGVVAKIEKPLAMHSLDEIVKAADALMVARGDLGVEVPPEDVPVLQRRIVRACRAAGKPVIVATQMLESMVSTPTATRAEASDVATAVYGGVDAIMLSAETATGDYPVEAVSMMDRIARRVEAEQSHPTALPVEAADPARTSAGALGQAVRAIADVVELAAAITYTSSGVSALRVAHLRPSTPIIGLTPSPSTARRLSLVWGVQPLIAADVADVESMVDIALTAAIRLRLSNYDRSIVIIAGVPFGTAGSTNLLRLVTPAELQTRSASMFTAAVMSADDESLAPEETL